MLESLRSLTKDTYLREIFLDSSTTNLHSTIVSDLHLDNPAVASDTLPSAVMVFGLEFVTHLEDVLTGINQARDIYAATLNFPVILWLTEEVASKMTRLAPDFKSWAASTIKFSMSKEDLITLVETNTESLYNKLLSKDTGKFLSNSTLNLENKSQTKREIELARNDLQRLYNVTLEPELEASVEFVLGRAAYAKEQIDEALVHFQRSLAFWQQQIGQNYLSIENHTKFPTPQSQFPTPQFPTPPFSTPNSPLPTLERQGLVLFHLGLCYRRMADLRPNFSKSYWQEALFWFKQCLELCEAAQREDLVAQFIYSVCEILHRLQMWEELNEFTHKSLRLHENYAMQPSIAQDYGFLAAVAGSESNWIQVHEWAGMALSIAENDPDVSRQQESWYLLLMGRAQRHMGEWEEAVNNLEWAKVVCELQYEPSLYLEILEELRELYFFERRDYTEAFHLKQEKIQIEHQYGYRAFIGASQLQPQRHKINRYDEGQLSVLEEGSNISVMPEEVAQEIAASGRKQDVQRLIERITRADCKLTIIHGPSGVGKSSILRAGLVPALKEKVIGERRSLPIVVSVYTDWVTTLGRSLNQVLAQTDLSVSLEITPSIILENIRLLTQKNYIVTLIFDQFEEFFFIKKQQIRSRQFYEFFSKCLNLAFVKIIFSLREDYLHHLLEFERLSLANSSYNLSVINHNILDKDIRYYLGKFSVQDAIGVIDVLTQRSHYELSNDLINQLVRDLASEVEEVHPIELQIVGAQLQAEKITTLEEYKHSGGSEKLVERWLEEVIKDCGRENQQIGWKLLFELTDEKGTRPLKTKVELSAALQNVNVNNNTNFDASCELILDILVASGLVLQLRDKTLDSYQLVHDYLVEPIRLKNNYGIVAELEKVRFEKTKAQVAQQISQEQLNSVLQRRLKEARIAGVVLAMMTTAIGGLWWQADIQRRSALRQTLRAERSETNLKISSIAGASEALFASGKEFDSLVESIRAFRRLKGADGVQADTRTRVAGALQQAVYGVAEKNRLDGHSDVLWSVTFSPDGQNLASASRDQTIKIWRRDGSIIQTLKAHSDSVTSVSYSPDGQTLVSSSFDKTVLLWRKNPNTGLFNPNPDKILEGHSDYVFNVDFSHDGQLLVSSSKDGTAKIWNQDGSLVRTLKGHQGWVQFAIFSPDGQFIATAGEDKTIKIWRRDGTLLRTLQVHKKGVTALAFSPNGQMLASGSKDTSVKLWRFLGNKDNLQVLPHKTLQKHTNTVWSLNFTPDSQEVISGSDDNTINHWNIGGSLIRTLKGHNDAVVSVAISPDNKILASASYDKSIKLWSLDPPTLPILRGHEDKVLSVAWSPDGQMLASGGRDRKVKLWQVNMGTDKEGGKLYRTMQGHTERVSSVSFAPDGQILASSSYDGTIKLWRRDFTQYTTRTS